MGFSLKRLYYPANHTSANIPSAADTMARRRCAMKGLDNGVCHLLRLISKDLPCEIQRRVKNNNSRSLKFNLSPLMSLLRREVIPGLKWVNPEQKKWIIIILSRFSLVASLDWKKNLCCATYSRYGLYLHVWEGVWPVMSVAAAQQVSCVLTES